VYQSAVIQGIKEEDRPKLSQWLPRDWGSTEIIHRGIKYEADKLPGFIAWRGSEPLGYILLSGSQQEWQVVVLRAFVSGHGIGSRLLSMAEKLLIQQGGGRLWMITTNDNLDALRFYQRKGFHLCQLHREAAEFSRTLKPSIPKFGLYGIPIRDELELEKYIEPPQGTPPPATHAP
tara:strand:+ start:21830 stop:22357 length:528 start_codon:yes stop_codon:yes gene_type:complete